MALLGSQRTCTRRREGVICGCILNPGLRVTVFSYLHLVCYALLTPVLLRYALSVLCTSGHCALCVAHSWPLHCVWYALLSPALRALLHFWALQSVHYTLLHPMHYTLLCALCNPEPCILYISHSCELQNMLHTPEPCTLCVIHYLALQFVQYALLTPMQSWAVHP